MESMIVLHVDVLVERSETSTLSVVREGNMLEFPQVFCQNTTLAGQSCNIWSKGQILVCEMSVQK